MDSAAASEYSPAAVGANSTRESERGAQRKPLRDFLSTWLLTLRSPRWDTEISLGILRVDWLVEAPGAPLKEGDGILEKLVRFQETHFDET